MKSIPVCVINLDRRGDRMKVMEKRLAGIDFIRISAVDGRELIPSDRDRKALESADYPMSLSELACIKSHLKVAQKMVDERWPHACVLEDDVKLSAHFGSFMKDDHWLSKRDGLIKIETMDRRIWMGRRRLSAAGGRSLHKLRSFHPGTAGYIISLDAAKKMVNLLEYPNLAADDLIFKRAVESGEVGEILQMSPALCVQEFVYSESCSESDILSDRKHLRLNAGKKPKGFRKIVCETKRPFNQLWGTSRYIKEIRCVVPFR